ncbi:hypothetical protein C8Q76DRAFT_720071 [Earliella scabrosa]|nr:hypothetical protein C8Q76DRAFT_720071 [Earliella scabrosa]
MRSRWSVGLTCFLAFLVCFQLVCAAPAESVTPSASLSSTERSRPTTRPARPTERPRPDGSPATTRGSAPAEDDDTNRGSSNTSTSSHSIFIAPITIHSTHPSWDRTPGHPITHTGVPRPWPTSPSPDSSSSTRSHGQSAVAIVFEVIGGAVGLLVLLALGRCYYSYRRTPPRDRISALLSRHQLEREMQEQARDRMARFSQAVETYRWRPPPPPYQHAPAYEEVAESDGSIDWGRPSVPPTTHPPTP